MNDCLFCKIAAGEIPSEKVYSDDFVYAFKDISPQAPVHILVIPREHIASAAEIDAGNSQVVSHIFEVIARLAADLKLEGFRIVSNVGDDAGQTVEHLHFHLLAGHKLGLTLG